MDAESKTRNLSRNKSPVARRRSREVESQPSRPSIASSELKNKRHVSDDSYVADVSLDIFYKPHSLVGLIVLLGIVVYNAFIFPEDDTARLRLIRGTMGAAFAFLALSMFALPSGPFIRPHPIVWRLLLGITILYWLALVAILFQDYADLRVFLGLAFPDLKPDKITGDLPWTEIDALDSDSHLPDCTFNYKNVMLRFDIFVTAHFAGWFVKSAMLRAYSVSFALSIWWEITEMFFMHILPNFVECWWDQFLLDVLIFNMLGTVMGIQLCRWLEVREYHWRNFNDLPTAKQKIKRAMQQFTPENWIVVKWTPLASWKRYVQVSILILLITLAELNAFFLKSTFEIRSGHPVNILRCVLWGFIGLPALRQTYVFMTDSSCLRIGTQAWVALAIILTEVMIWVKFGFVRPNAPWKLADLSSTVLWWLPSLFIFTYVFFTAGKHIEDNEWLQRVKRRWGTKVE